jgi:hypothetical protein
MKQTTAFGEMWTYSRSVTKIKDSAFGSYYDPNASRTSAITVTFDDKDVVRDTNTLEMGTMMTGTVTYDNK